MTRGQPPSADPARPSGPGRWLIGGVIGLGVIAAILGVILLRPGDDEPVGQASPTPSASLGPTPTPTLNQDLLSRRLTVLLLGLDSDERRRDKNKGVNSDAIMLASISADQSEVTLIGVPRDTANVPLPDGTTWGGKLNGVYAAQGVDGMRGAVSELLQVPIDAYVTIDMGDLSDMVDAVGGVDVNPHAPLVDRHLDLRLKAGPQHLDGETANGYVRTRFDTDYARAARQQEVLLQIVQRLVDPATEVDIPQLLDALHSFETDLSLADMPTFIELARRAQDAVVTEQVLNPQDGFITSEGDFGDGRGYILIPDIEKMRRFAQRHLSD
ncbi:MAG TPA: LCP family protein [Candidatus Limnocylindria bacterium]|nr:LCP family protein [Candidatus Limnocylindria bacterium]